MRSPRSVPVRAAFVAFVALVALLEKKMSNLHSHPRELGFSTQLLLRLHNLSKMPPSIMNITLKSSDSSNHNAVASTTITRSSSGSLLPHRVVLPPSESPLLDEETSESLPVTPRSPGSKSNSVEKVGRWTEEEHVKFLEGLEKYGKQWKQISSMIGTRTVVQVRTHAQKYFQKMERQTKPAAATSSSSSSSSSSTNGSPTVPKRKSLPPSLPSRKKAKSSRPKGIARASSISMTSTNSSTSSFDMPPYTNHPGYFSSTSSENWSTISPAGVMDIVDLAHFEKGSSDDNFLETMEFTTLNNKQVYPNVSSSDTLQELDDVDDDPLNWLVDDSEASVIVHQYLPESSLPFFPDLGSITVHKSSLISNNIMIDLSNNKADNSVEPQIGCSLIDVEATLDMVDPSVTVQSLFLPAE